MAAGSPETDSAEREIRDERKRETVDAVCKLTQAAPTAKIGPFVVFGPPANPRASLLLNQRETMTPGANHV